MNSYMTQRDLISTARLTGLWYLILAVSGVLGFLILHPQIYIANEPEKTLANLMEKESIARIRLLFELVIVISQALAAVWFYKLFKNSNEWGAYTLSIWGMMNSAVIMVSAISMGTVLEVASSPVLSFSDKVSMVFILEQLMTNAWGVGGLFFGLWLIPMGYVVVTSNSMPVWLGRVLIIGGIGYLLSTFINYIGLTNPYLDVLIIPATIGEFWMIGYLLWFGVRTSNE
jgi:hypothetical protein